MRYVALFNRDVVINSLPARALFPAERETDLAAFDESFGWQIDVLKIPRSKVYNNLEKYGNTSAGSIPLVVDEAIVEGRLKRGDLTILSGFGAGLAWGTALMRW